MPDLTPEWVEAAMPIPVEFALCKHLAHRKRQTVLGSFYLCERADVDGLPLEHRRLQEQFFLRGYMMVEIAEKCGYSFLNSMTVSGPFPWYPDEVTKLWNPSFAGLSHWEQQSDVILREMGHRPDYCEYRLRGLFLKREGSKLPVRSLVRLTGGIPSPEEAPV